MSSVVGLLRGGVDEPESARRGGLDWELVMPYKSIAEDPYILGLLGAVVTGVSVSAAPRLLPVGGFCGAVRVAFAIRTGTLFSFTSSVGS